jgi:hypothetical protein
MLGSHLETKSQTNKGSTHFFVDQKREKALDFNMKLFWDNLSME